MISNFGNVFDFGVDSVYCLFDGLKPSLTPLFLHKARKFFDRYGLKMFDHNSQ